MNAAQSQIGRNGNPTQAQHEFFEKMGHSWLNDDSIPVTTVVKVSEGKSFKQYQALEAKRKARLVELGLDGVTQEDLL